VPLEAIDPLALAIALRLAQLRRTDAGAKRRLLARLDAIAERVKAHQDDDQDEASLSPAGICVRRALRASDNGTDTTAYRLALESELVAFMRR
jgi:hypothetical protein